MRLLRLAGALLAATALVAGCSADSRPESPPTPTASAPSSTAPSDPGTPSPTPSTAPSTKVSAAAPGSEGLTVRYLDADGKIRTLEPKDFPR